MFEQFVIRIRSSFAFGFLAEDPLSSFAKIGNVQHSPVDDLLGGNSTMTVRASVRFPAGIFAAVMVLFATSGQSATQNILYCFGEYDDGADPYAGMTNVNGVLYGTTNTGGSGSCESIEGTRTGCGVVFSFEPQTKTEKVVHSFAGGEDGEYPYSRLIYANGILYGTTYQGGSGSCETQDGYGCGTVFSIDPATGAESVLYSFQSGDKDGQYPVAAPVVLDSDPGELFGTTSFGGTGSCQYLANGCGTVFKINLTTDTETIIYSFQNNGMDANYPTIDWTRLDGRLYSETSTGGAYGRGAVFSIDPKTSAETVLHSFQDTGTDGFAPYASMKIFGHLLYGTTFNGGTNCLSEGCGTLFSLDPKTGKEVVVYSFCSQQSCADGGYPTSDLIQHNGILYGTTADGGGENCHGAMYAFDPKSGTERTVTCNSDDTRNPFQNTRLTDLHGTLYGTLTQAESCFFYGAIYSITQ